MLMLLWFCVWFISFGDFAHIWNARMELKHCSMKCIEKLLMGKWFLQTEQNEMKEQETKRIKIVDRKKPSKFVLLVDQNGGKGYI